MTDCVSRLDDSIIDASIDHLLRIYSDHGSTDYIGEAITQTQHGLQCAALGVAAKAPPEVIIAALFHDVGHLIGLEGGCERMGELGISKHEIIGEELLKKLGFPELTYKLVARHVDAKRYQCRINPSYYDKLSDASKGTLAYQGSPMSDEEVKNFENDPMKRWILLLRSWDEKAKVKDLKVADMESYRGMMREIIRRNLERREQQKTK